MKKKFNEELTFIQKFEQIAFNILRNLKKISNKTCFPLLFLKYTDLNMEIIFKTFAFVKKIHPPFFEKLNFFNCLSFLSHYIIYFKIKKICRYIYADIHVYIKI